MEGIGYKAARAEQRRAILSFMQGKDVFVSLSDIDIPTDQAKATTGGSWDLKNFKFNCNIRRQLNSLRLGSH